MKRILVLLLSVSSLICSCGDVNLNGYVFVRDSQNKALDVLLHDAQYYYDQGEFKDAMKAGEEAFKLNNDNEEVRILLGYIYLALGGIDTFSLSKSLINQFSTGSTTTLALAEDKDAASTLSGLSSITKITESDYPLMGTEQESDVTIFADLPVIYPTDAPTARAAVESLNYINKAIEMACPSVDDVVKIDSDPRHQNAVCPESQFTVTLAGKAHFLWAFGHLADALSFNKIIQYSTDDEGNKPNLEKRGEKASMVSSADISSYADAMSTLAEDINSIMITDDENSQLNAVYNGLEAANLAFGQMTGVPAKITGGISKALDSIKKGATDSGKSENEVLKGQLNKKVSSQLATKIDATATEKPVEFAANKSKLCSTFTTISQGQGTKPTSCN